ncbi:hypothetical protein [Parasitella parasitica]|uniref:Uncharacterized protein n=1 Tax=Parasitella parasitica TaxID=35722 RepID=A0A0B7NQT6_9FUNG|nr:hypothetical protein [Parasitella parasitica]
MASVKEMDKQEGKIREPTSFEDEAPVKSKKSSQKKEKTRKPKKKSSKSKGLGLIKSDPLDTVSGLGEGVLSGGGQQGQQNGGSNGQQPLSLRLDLNLEVEITLKARVHGDVTLALLA